MSVVKVTAQVGDKTIEIEAGKIAKQADGAVTVRCGETIVLVAAVAATKARPGMEFFPLTVDYREKAAAAGRFPGGYFKREGRPSEKEILTCRLTDRPIRPLFPKGWFNEVQVQSIVLSADGENDSDILSMIGASAALLISDIPWEGPLGAIRLARVNGAWVPNPTHAERAESDVDLVYVGNANDVVMFEGSAQELPEADFVQALRSAQEFCQPLLVAQRELAEKIGRPKREINASVVPDDILTEAKNLVVDRMVPALLIPGKMAREAAVKALSEEMNQKLVEKFGAEQITEFIIREASYSIQKEAVRKLILDSSKRLDGRGFDDVRSIQCEVGILPRAHGSALFTRGETQTIVMATLGTSEESQEFDAYAGGETEKQFILHYNFPNFSVGETGRISGPGRREIGHGALAERSLEPMIPLDEYPYTVRVTSEITESNGSSSMATVCGGSLAMMDAGIPITRPVAGISIGICVDYDDQKKINRSQLLTDIIGWEDGFCDMDCKIAGTANGITGFQLDLKLRGLPHDLMEKAIEKARVARLFILDEMAKTIAAPRAEMSKYAPRIVTVKINPEKIGALIGPGGKNIKRIVEESGCEINIEDDGTVNIYSTSAEGMEKARSAVEGMTAEAEIGKVYRGKVVTIKEFGCFVEFLPGKDGLCHISELANFRVKQTEDIVKIGDEIWVKCLGVDEKGRVRLSRRAAMAERDSSEGGGEPSDGPDEGRDYDPSGREGGRESQGREGGGREGGGREGGGREAYGREGGGRQGGGRPSGGRQGGGREGGGREGGGREGGGREGGGREGGGREGGGREGGGREGGGREGGGREGGGREGGGRGPVGREQRDGGRRGGERPSHGGAPRRD